MKKVFFEKLVVVLFFIFSVFIFGFSDRISVSAIEVIKTGIEILLIALIIFIIGELVIKDIQQNNDKKRFRF